MERKKIEDYLASKGIPYSCMGFEYLADAIEIAYKNKGRLFLMEVYEAIETKHFASKSSVERCIRHAIHKTGETITNKEFIVRTVYMLKRDRGEAND